MQKTQEIKERIEQAGGRYVATSRYRHPSVSPFVLPGGKGFGLFDSEKMVETLLSSLSFIEQLGKKKDVILFVSSRRESVDLMEQIAKDLSLPYMLNRWIGGTLSNFRNIRGRVERMERLRKDRDDEKWLKYTKKERVLLNRELAKLENRFSGIDVMDVPPAAVFVLDTKKDAITVEEANRAGIPVIGFSNADADMSVITHPIVANIRSRDTVSYILSLVKEAYEAGARGGKEEA